MMQQHNTWCLILIYNSIQTFQDCFGCLKYKEDVTVFLSTKHMILCRSQCVAHLYGSHMNRVLDWDLKVWNKVLAPLMSIGKLPLTSVGQHFTSKSFSQPCS